MPESKKWSRRLPKSFRPIHYDLTLNPDLDKLLFAGNVNIHLKVQEDASLIRLNSHELKINEVKLFQNGKSMEIASYELLADIEELHIRLPTPVSQGAELNLQISYEGELNTTLRGFYATKQSSGKFGAVCHFEATGARMAFPCWDEPEFRATFKITLQMKEQENFAILSNMPEDNRKPIEKGKVLFFFC